MAGGEYQCSLDVLCQPRYAGVRWCRGAGCKLVGGAGQQVCREVQGAVCQVQRGFPEVGDPRRPGSCSASGHGPPAAGLLPCRATPRLPPRAAAGDYPQASHPTCCSQYPDPPCRLQGNTLHPLTLQCTPLYNLLLITLPQHTFLYTLPKHLSVHYPPPACLSVN